MVKGKKFRAKGLHWEILDEELAKQTIIEDKKNKMTKEEYDRLHSKKMTTTGIFRVSKKKNKKYKKGFLWSYNYTDDTGKRRTIQAVLLSKLKEKVEAAGLPWEIVNEELATKTIKEDSND